MGDNLRKVVSGYRGWYELLKLREDGSGRWNRYGKRKSLKAISDIEKSGRFVIEVPDSIKEEIEDYRKSEIERRKSYLDKGLASKVI